MCLSNLTEKEAIKFEFENLLITKWGNLIPIYVYKPVYIYRNRWHFYVLLLITIIK